jgi:hypothetical protein
MSGHGFNSPGSSPPELPLTVTWFGEGEFPFRRNRNDTCATYTKHGTANRRLEWWEALRLGEQFYNNLVALFEAQSMTGNGSRLVAVLVAPYVDRNISNLERSMIFMSTIPRGTRASPGARNLLEGPDGGHDTWREHCYRTEHRPTTAAGPWYATALHAEDNAINMFLSEVAVSIVDDIEWLGNNFMVVYGLRAGVRETQQGRPSQVLPCGPRSVDEHNNKVPCCQWVLDRMFIEWRFGIAGGYPPRTVQEPPEPQLPEHPPGRGSGSGQGGGGYGAEPPASGYRPQNPWTDEWLDDDTAAQHWPDGAARAHVKGARAVIPSRPKTNTPGRLVPGKPPTQQKEPLSELFAKLSLNSTTPGKPQKQRAVNPLAAGTVLPLQGAGVNKGQAGARNPAGPVSVANTKATQGTRPSAGGQAPAIKPPTNQVQKPDPGPGSGGGGGTTTRISRPVDNISPADARKPTATKAQPQQPKTTSPPRPANNASPPAAAPRKGNITKTQTQQSHPKQAQPETQGTQKMQTQRVVRGVR